MSRSIPLKTEALNKLREKLEEKRSKSQLVWDWIQNFIKTDIYKSMPKDECKDLIFANSPFKKTDGVHYSVCITPEGFLYDSFCRKSYTSEEALSLYNGVQFIYEQIISDQVYSILYSSII